MGPHRDVVRNVDQYLDEKWHFFNGVDESRLLGQLSEVRRRRRPPAPTPSKSLDLTTNCRSVYA